MGESASDGLTKACSGREEFQKADDRADESIKDKMALVSSDDYLPESTRQRLIDFWANCMELKSYVVDPRGSFNSFSAKYRELSDNHDRMAESLSLLLGEKK